MSELDASTLPPISDEHRRIAVENFERANQVLASGNHDYAIQLLKTCCKIDPSNMVYRQTLRRTQKAKFNNNMRGSRFSIIGSSRYKARIKVAKRSRDYLRVLEYAEEILTRNPWDTGAQMDMAQAFEALGLLHLAVFSLDQARQKNPRDVTVNRALARLLEKTGQFAQAIKLWQLVREVEPDDLEAAHKAKDLAASETIKRGGYDSHHGEVPIRAKSSDSGVSLKTPPPPVDRVTREAQPLLSKLEADPTDHNLYLELASLFRRSGQADRARAVLQQGLGPTGSHPQLLIEMMELDLEPFRRNLRHTDERLRRLEANPGGDDDDEELTGEELRRMRHKLLKEINARELELCRMRADRQPNDLNLRMDLGIRLLRAERIDEAIVEFQLARRDERLRGRAAMYLGFCFKRRNNWRLARRNFEEALEHIPPREEEQRKEVMFQLAQGHAEAGELEEALELGHELANIDFAFREIGQLLDEWEERLNEAT